MYHLSKNNLNKQIIFPKIPNNFFTKNNFEDGVTKRICFSPTIDKCLMALGYKAQNQEFFVHIPKVKTVIQIYKPSIKEVPDSEITDEMWILEPIEFQCVGKILCESPTEKSFTFSYGSETAKLWKWKWKWLRT